MSRGHNTGHYADGRRWSHIYQAWILESSWNDKEEIARLQYEIEKLREEMDTVIR